MENPNKIQHAPYRRGVPLLWLDVTYLRDPEAAMSQELERQRILLLLRDLYKFFSVDNTRIVDEAIYYMMMGG